MINIAEPISSQKGKPTTMCLVIHAADVPAEACIDGRGIIIPPNTIFEVPAITCTDHNNNGPYEYTTPADQVMKAVLQQCWSYGLVEVPVVKEQGKYGVQYGFDEAKAHEAAKKALLEAEDQMINDYVTIQRARMMENLAVLPPNARTAQIIDKHHIDLEKQFNLKPIGYNTAAKAAAAGEEMNALRRDNEELRAKFDALLARLGEEPKGKK